MMAKDSFKRLKSRSLDSEKLMIRTKIGDLPEALLVEILCRLPCNKLIFQCKLVSKPWYNLISAPYFVGRYLCLQRQMQKPILLTTLVLFDVAIRPKSLIITSDHPVFKSAANNFTLNFLPCYSQAKEIEEPGHPFVTPFVVATYNDLVLCCATKKYQSDYYLCNPYTKQWFSLPPTPGLYRDALVGFICDPYFKNSDHSEEGEERITRFSSFILNAEYKWKVVRVVPNSSDPNFHFEIFSSETRQWREIFVACSQPFSSFASEDYFNNFRKPISSFASVAYNGLLYWWCENGLILELDISNSINRAKYRFIEPIQDFEIPESCGIGILGVSGGRLQLCMHEEYIPRDHAEVRQAFRVRELKQVVKGSQGKLKWLADRVTISPKVDPIMSNYPTVTVLAFYPNNEDVVYFAQDRKIIECNLRGGTLEKISESPVRGSNRRIHYSFSLPWWPTPVPKTLE